MRDQEKYDTGDALRTPAAKLYFMNLSLGKLRASASVDLFKGVPLNYNNDCLSQIK